MIQNHLNKPILFLGVVLMIFAAFNKSTVDKYEDPYYYLWLLGMFLIGLHFLKRKYEN